MQSLPQPFNAAMHDPTQGVGGLPIGKHIVTVETTEVKATKDNSGGYIQLNLKVMDGPNAGSTGAYRLNIYNSNQQAVEIANRQLSAVCHVTGQMVLNSPDQLKNIPFMVEVGPQKDKPEYTEVKKVFDAAGNEPGKAPAAGAPAQPAAPAQDAAPAAGWGGAPAAGTTPEANAPAQTPAQPAADNTAAPAANQPWGAPAQPAAPAQQPANPATAPAGGNPPWGNPNG